MESLTLLINPYDVPEHTRAIVDVLDSYASDPMGGGEPLAPTTRTSLVQELKSRDWIVTLLALSGAEPVGLLIAMEGFSTFQAKPLMNIHDVAVVPSMRGKGIGKQLFAALEEEARRRGCCKLTLEVLSGNERAIKVYQRLGFEPYALDPSAGTAQFWEKKLQG